MILTVVIVFGLFNVSYSYSCCVFILLLTGSIAWQYFTGRFYLLVDITVRYIYIYIAIY